MSNKDSGLNSSGKIKKKKWELILVPLDFCYVRIIMFPRVKGKNNENSNFIENVCYHLLAHYLAFIFLRLFQSNACRVYFFDYSLMHFEW